jgi:hypothetical protein
MGNDRDTVPAVHEAVDQVAAPAIGTDELKPKERAFLERHALKKPLRVLDIWGLGLLSPVRISAGI